MFSHQGIFRAGAWSKTEPLRRAATSTRFEALLINPKNNAPLF
jgi:hypothetical protein